MRFTLPKVDKAPQGNARVHPHERARRTKAWRDAACWSAKTLRQARLGLGVGSPVVVTFTHVRADKRRADPDNLGAILKPVLDGCVDAGLLPDDSWRWVTEVRLRIRHDSREEFVIEFEEVN